GAVTVAIGWSGYVVSLFEKTLGWHIIPAAYASAPYAFDPNTGWSSTGAVVNLPAMFVIAGVTLLLVIGVEESAGVNSIIVVIKVAIVLFFIIAGVAFISALNWKTSGNPGGTFIPPNLGKFGEYGFSGIWRGAAVVFFAYIGFDAVSTAAQEA